jgi:hypothetical protein
MKMKTDEILRAGSLPGRQQPEFNVAQRALWQLQQQSTASAPAHLRLVVRGFPRPTSTLDRRARHLALKLAANLMERAVADLALGRRAARRSSPRKPGVARAGAGARAA